MSAFIMNIVVYLPNKPVLLMNRTELPSGQLKDQ